MATGCFTHRSKLVRLWPGLARRLVADVSDIGAGHPARMASLGPTVCPSVQVCNTECVSVCVSL